MTVDGGDKVDLERFRGRAEQGGRDPVSQTSGHSIVERLVDALGEMIGDRSGSVRSVDNEES